MTVMKRHNSDSQLDMVLRCINVLQDGGWDKSLQVLEVLCRTVQEGNHGTFQLLECLEPIESLIRQAHPSVVSLTITPMILLRNFKRALCKLLNTEPEQEDSHPDDHLGFQLCKESNDKTSMQFQCRSLLTATLFYIWLLSEKQRHDHSDSSSLVQETHRDNAYLEASRLESELCDATFPVLDLCIKYVSLLTDEMEDQQSQGLNTLTVLHYSTLVVWGMLLCALTDWTAVKYHTCTQTPLRTGGPSHSFARWGDKPFQRALETVSRVLAVLVHSHPDRLHASGFFRAYAQLVVSESLPHGALKSCSLLKQVLHDALFVYVGHESTYRVLTLLICYMSLNTLESKDSHRSASSGKTVHTGNTVWCHAMRTAFDHIDKDLQIVSELNLMRRIEKHHRFSMTHLARLLFLLSQLCRYNSGSAESSALRSASRTTPLVCTHFPLRHLLHIIIQSMDVVVTNAKILFHCRMKLFSHSLQSQATTTGCDTEKNQDTLHNQELGLLQLHPIMQNALLLLTSLLDNVPPSVLLLYAHVLKRLVYLFFDTSLYTSNDTLKEDVVKFHLETWAIQCRYSQQLLCIISLLLNKVPCVLKDRKIQHHLLSFVQHTFRCVTNPAAYAAHMWQASCHQEHSTLLPDCVHNSDAPLHPNTASFLTALLQFISPDVDRTSGMSIAREVSPLHFSHKIEVYCGRLLFLCVDAVTLAHIIYTTFSPNAFDVPMRAQLDEAVVRLLWRLTVTNNNVRNHQQVNLNIWSFPCLNDQKIDHRIVLTFQLVRFLEVSFLGVSQLPSSLLSIAIAVLYRVESTTLHFLYPLTENRLMTTPSYNDLKHKIAHVMYSLRYRLMSSVTPVSLSVMDEQRINSYSTCFAEAQQRMTKADSHRTAQHVPPHEKEMVLEDMMEENTVSKENPHIQGNAQQDSPANSLTLSHVTPDVSHDIVMSVPTCHERGETVAIQPTDLYACVTWSGEDHTVVLRQPPQDLLRSSDETPSPYSSKDCTGRMEICATKSAEYQASCDSLLQSAISCSNSEGGREHEELLKPASSPIFLDVQDPSLNDFVTPSGGGNEKCSDENSSIESNPQHSSLTLLRKYEEDATRFEPVHQCEVTSYLRYCGLTVCGSQDEDSGGKRSSLCSSRDSLKDVPDVEPFWKESGGSWVKGGEKAQSTVSGYTPPVMPHTKEDTQKEDDAEEDDVKFLKSIGL